MKWALIGLKGSGKDTYANMNDHGYPLLAFAQPLKDCVKGCFAGVDIEDRQLKEKPVELDVALLCERVESWTVRFYEALGEPLPDFVQGSFAFAKNMGYPHHLGASVPVSPRDLLKAIGSPDWLRKDPNGSELITQYTVQQALQNENAIITDCRLKDEVRSLINQVPDLELNFVLRFDVANDVAFLPIEYDGHWTEQLAGELSLAVLDFINEEGLARELNTIAVQKKVNQFAHEVLERTIGQAVPHFDVLFNQENVGFLFNPQPEPLLQAVMKRFKPS